MKDMKMEEQRKKCKEEYEKTHLQGIPGSWAVWKRAYDRGASNVIKNHSDLSNVSDCFVVHNSGVPISYHKTEKGADKSVKEWHDSGIEAAKKIRYSQIEIVD